jgi:hypothetical protein
MLYTDFVCEHLLPSQTVDQKEKTISKQMQTFSTLNHGYSDNGKLLHTVAKHQNVLQGETTIENFDTFLHKKNCLGR